MQREAYAASYDLAHRDAVFVVFCLNPLPGTRAWLSGITHD